MLCFICNFSAQRKRIQIFNKQHVDVQDKIFIIKVIFANSSARDVGQKISRFNSGRRILILVAVYLTLCLLTILSAGACCCEKFWGFFLALADCSLEFLLSSPPRCRHCRTSVDSVVSDLLDLPLLKFSELVC